MVKRTPPLVEPLGRQLVFTAKAMRQVFEATLEAAGGSLASWVVLSTLAEQGCVSQAVLAGHVRLEGATITHHVDRLEAAGLVRRLLDPSDRRVRKLELTDAGSELHALLFDAVVRLQAEVMAGLDDDDRAVLGRSLAVIQANLASLSSTATELPYHAEAG